MNRINQTLQNKKDQKLLSIYFTAGFPELEDTVEIIKELEKNGVDMIEIGLPFSDPLADGPTIQKSSEVALRNGMGTATLFRQLQDIRSHVTVPLLIMGYFNPMLQFGIETFCQKCKECGIDGLIIPDLPLEEYELRYQQIFEQHNLLPIFLITPQTPEVRIRQIDAASKGFIYMVSSAGVTGSTKGFGREQQEYFSKVAAMELTSPLITGFGITDGLSFQSATRYTSGGIIGSAFINQLRKDGINGISAFIESLRSTS